MKLQLIDWMIIVGTLLICFVPALFFGRRGSKNASEFLPLSSLFAIGNYLYGRTQRALVLMGMPMVSA